MRVKCRAAETGELPAVDVKAPRRSDAVCRGRTGRPGPAQDHGDVWASVTRPRVCALLLPGGDSLCLRWRVAAAPAPVLPPPPRSPTPQREPERNTDAPSCRARRGERTRAKRPSPKCGLLLVSFTRAWKCFSS